MYETVDCDAFFFDAVVDFEFGVYENGYGNCGDFFFMFKGDMAPSVSIYFVPVVRDFEIDLAFFIEIGIA